MPEESAEPEDQDAMPRLMSWIDKLRRKQSDDEHKQLLFFSTGDLINENYAVVRTTWYEKHE